MERAAAAASFFYSISINKKERIAPSATSGEDSAGHWWDISLEMMAEM
jgi:hypothetical protein